MAKVIEPKYEGPDYVTENLLGRDDFLSKALKLMSSCIDSSLILCTSDKETASSVLAVISDYWKRIPLVDFFVQKNIKEIVVDELNNNITLLSYFQTLDLQFTMHLKSIYSDMNYSDIVDRVFSLIEPTKNSPRECIYRDNIKIAQNYDLDTSKGLLKTNSILLTLYLFRLAFPFSSNGLNGQK